MLLTYVTAIPVSELGQSENLPLPRSEIQLWGGGVCVTTSGCKLGSSRLLSPKAPQHYSVFPSARREGNGEVRDGCHLMFISTPSLLLLLPQSALRRARRRWRWERTLSKTNRRC